MTEQWLEERLFDRRILLASGYLTREAASRLAAQLMTLDAAGTGPVDLRLACPDGDLEAVFALVDALDLMATPVAAVVTGELGGGALGVLAAADRRLAYGHARFRLAEPRVEQLNGTADQVLDAASRHLRLLDDLVERLAAVTGQPRSRIEDDLAAGRVLTAAQAREYGLIDTIVGKS